MAGAAFFFSLMAVCVKWASAHHGAAEIVLWRSAVGVIAMALWLRAARVPVRTQVPWMHLRRSGSGVLALLLWFHAIGGLPLATAMTLNYMSSVWMALFVMGAALLGGRTRVEGRLVLAVLAGFAGVTFVLQPTFQASAWVHGVSGLLSGMLSAAAYLQVSALGRAGEPEGRVVFYFSLGGVLVGGLGVLVTGVRPYSLHSVALLLAVGVLATVAQLMMTRAYAIGATLANAALAYLAVVFAVLFGVLWFDEPLNVPTLTGIALIVGAGMMATFLRQRASAPGGPRS